MKQDLVARFRGQPNALHEVRHAIHLEILAAIYGPEAPASDWVFMGGTCLHVLYDLPRYSEDLDFVASGTAEAARLCEAIAARFQSGGFDATVVPSTKVEGIWRAQVRIAGVLKDLGLAALPEQKLSVHIEVDIRPPAGAQVEETALDGPAAMTVRHHDLPSLMAGKIGAVLSRAYDKGRDWYDLAWYLEEGIEPNLELLDGGLKQIPSRYCAHAENWREGVLRKGRAVDWQRIQADVRPFLIDEEEASQLTGEYFKQALSEPPRRKQNLPRGPRV